MTIQAQIFYPMSYLRSWNAVRLSLKIDLILLPRHCVVFLLTTKIRVAN